MTPFGARIRRLRAKRGISLKQMARDLGVSSAYLSALEHGHRGRPAPGLIQQMAGYFSLIWDEVEEIKRLAQLSHPRVVVDTSGLHEKATLAANLLAERVGDFEETELDSLVAMLTQRPRTET